MEREGFFVKFPLASRVLTWIILPLVMLIYATYYLLSNSVASSEGEVKASGIKDNVRVVRDKYAVPYIKAKSELDTYYALGFTHAQERIWQMDLNRKIASGRIAEAFGETFSSIDVIMRTLGFSHHAKTMWNEMPAEDKKILQAYTNGVNAAIHSFDVLPPEYKIKGLDLQPWSTTDSLLVMQKFAWDMATNMGDEVRRTLLLQALGKDKTHLLMPDAKTNIQQISDIASRFSVKNTLLMDKFSLAPKSFVGSNGWVVSGDLTESGAPILATDPHLETVIPSQWFLASLQGGELNVTGATIPGLPFVLMGKNTDIAWGITSMHADTQDIVIEKINPTNRNQYYKDGAYHDMQIIDENVEIQRPFVNDSPPLRLKVRRTEHGPVISDYASQIPDFVYSLRWTGDRLSVKSFSSFIKLNKAHDWRSFNEAMREHTAPVFNMVYADTKGNIGYLAPGYIPIRGKGQYGDIPSFGSSSQLGWEGRIPFEQYPRQYNPESGVIVTANQKVVDDAYPYHITTDWRDTARATRIESEIKRLTANGSKISVDDMKALQHDVYSPSVDQLLPFMLSVGAETDEEKEALKLIKSWDKVLGLESAGGALYMSWLSYMNMLVISDEFKGNDLDVVYQAVAATLITEPNYGLLYQVMSENTHDWCDHKETQDIETCADMSQRAFQLAVKELLDIESEEIADWEWGSLHEAEFTHFPFSGGEGVADIVGMALFDRSRSSAGNGDSVNVAPVLFGVDGKYSQSFAATYRQVIDMAPSAKSFFINSTGQSGNPLSKHYDDMLFSTEANYVEMHADIPPQSATSTLMLLPAKQ